VIGGGLAGSTAALVLARAHFSVVIVDTSNDRNWKVGESLPPEAGTLLRKLGVWERFIKDSHLPSYGNRSAWGAPYIEDNDFVFNPYGHGWHLDRHQFNAMLANAAVTAGAVRLCRTKLLDWQCTQQNRWLLNLLSVGQHASLQADWIIDASGRTSFFAQRQGVKRQVYDRLISAVMLLEADTSKPKQGEDDSFSLIEAAPEGWWYSAFIPNRRLVVAYMSDGDLVARRYFRTVESWQTLLSQSDATWKRVQYCHYRPVGIPQIVLANSTCLTAAAGRSWLAAGDAAAAYDPLSSQGISVALATGLDAATSIQAYMSGEETALEHYSHRIKRMYADYLLQREAYYRMEQRWPTSPFWQRRRFT